MMNTRLSELLILFAVFVSPLIHASIEDSFQTRRTWSWLAFLSVTIIVFFATYQFRVQRNFSLFTILLSILIASGFFLGLYTANAFALYLVLLGILLCAAVRYISSTSIHKKNIVVVMLIGCIALYAQWGIAQFIVQHDLGLSKIGESVLTTNIPGIASFYLGSEKFIRAYGPFGHSNIFAGVLLLGALLVYRYIHTLKSNLFVQGVLFITSLGLLVSFSRTALLGLTVLAILLGYKKHKTILIPLLITGLLFLPLIFHRSTDMHGAAVQERAVGIEWFIQSMNTESLLRGFGPGNYTAFLTDYLHQRPITHNPWDIAPIHSVPLLLLAELGILICIPLIVLFIRFLLTYKPWILLVLAPALLLDHYFATQLSPFIFLTISTLLVVQ